MALFCAFSLQAKELRCQDLFSHSTFRQRGEPVDIQYYEGVSSQRLYKDLRFDEPKQFFLGQSANSVYFLEGWSGKVEHYNRETGEIVFVIPLGTRIRAQIGMKTSFWGRLFLQKEIRDMEVLPRISYRTQYQGETSDFHQLTESDLQNIAQSQVMPSNTFKNSSEKDLFLLSQKQGFELLYRRLLENRGLDMPLLSELHRTLLQSEAMIRDDVKIEELGQVRNVKKNVPLFTSESGLMYVTPELVPSRLQHWLVKANELHVGTPLGEVVRLYRDFLFIHPFLDGNGRTSRALLDYMLLKSGHPPVHHNDRTSVFIYQSLGEHTQNVLEALSH